MQLLAATLGLLLLLLPAAAASLSSGGGWRLLNTLKLDPLPAGRYTQAEDTHSSHMMIVCSRTR